MFSFGLEVLDLGVSDIWKWIILDGWPARGRTGLMEWVNENHARWFVMCGVVVVLLLGEDIRFRLMVINLVSRIWRSGNTGFIARFG